jgi:hypothetical protein
VVSPLDLHFPEKPLQIEAKIAPIQATPIEVKPIELRLPKEELHVAVGGIPQSIKIDADTKGVPLNVRWPETPLNITVNLASKPNDKVSDGKECKCTPVPTSSPRANPYSEKNEPRQGIDDDHTAKGKVGGDTWWATLWHPILIIALFAFFGAVGGIASTTVDFLKHRKQLKQSLRELGAGIEAIQNEIKKQVALDTNYPAWEQEIQKRLAADTNYQDKQRQDTELNARLQQFRWKYNASWASSLFLGMVAGLFVPIGILFIPGFALRTMSTDPFELASLYSLSFALGMIGEPFIEFVLNKLRSLTTNKESMAEPTSSSPTATSKSDEKPSPL